MAASTKTGYPSPISPYIPIALACWDPICQTGPHTQVGWLAKTVIAGEDAPFYHDGFNEGLNRAMNEL